FPSNLQKPWFHSMPPFDARKLLRCVASLGAALCFAPSLYVILNEQVEHRIIKGSFLHNHWIKNGQLARLPSGDGPLIVFQHIPRTGGDSMRNHIFRDEGATLKTSDLWPRLYEANNWSTSFLESDFDTAMHPSTKMISGYYSRVDLQTLSRPTKVFTFIRHPVERIVSLFNMASPKWNDMRGPMNVTTFVESGTLWRYSCAFTWNSMTYQLGDRQQCQLRSTDDGQAVLQRAKEALEKAAFVGFYETLDEDFWELKERIFPEVKLPYYIPFAFWVGSWLGLPRLRVLKFSAHLSQKDLDRISGFVNLDLQLYEWAKQRFKPGLTLHRSYASFFLANPIYSLALACLLMSPFACWRFKCGFDFRQKLQPLNDSKSG
ncbi:unnamed protein product, partial [Polarella glacialis]